MIIDAHQHVFWHGKDDTGLVADMDEQGIAQAWVLTWEIPPDEDDGFYHRALNPCFVRADGTHCGIPLSDVLKARDRYPDRFVMGYCPDPRHRQACALLESAHRIHGARVCGEWKFRTLLDDPRCIELFRTAGALGMPVTLHIDVPYRRDDEGEAAYVPTWYGGTVANLERALQACPETVFLGHAPGFWREISGDADTANGAYPTGSVQPGGRLYGLFDRNANLYGDLSAGSGLKALSRDAAHAKAFITRFADRLLFARDGYGGELKAFLDALNLPADVHKKLYHENAVTLLGAAHRSMIRADR